MATDARPSDADAIKASLTGPPAFRAVFDRHFDALHRYVQQRVGIDAADEVAAETFTRAFDSRRRYDLTHQDARPWLLGIASNIIRRHWRDERRRLAAYARSFDPNAQVAESHAQGLSSEIAAALVSLEARDREALLLLAWGDLSYEEVALALNIPAGTVRSRIFRARRLVRERLSVRDATPNVHSVKEGCDVRA